MPGFSNNSQQRAGNALGANATGSVRIPLEPYSYRYPYTGNAHVADTEEFRNNGVPMPVSGTKPSKICMDFHGVGLERTSAMFGRKMSAPAVAAHASIGT